jgi:hypothetical protein
LASKAKQQGSQAFGNGVGGFDYCHCCYICQRKKKWKKEKKLKEKHQRDLYDKNNALLTCCGIFISSQF